MRYPVVKFKANQLRLLWYGNIISRFYTIRNNTNGVDSTRQLHAADKIIPSPKMVSMNAEKTRHSKWITKFVSGQKQILIVATRMLTYLKRPVTEFSHCGLQQDTVMLKMNPISARMLLNEKHLRTSQVSYRRPQWLPSVARQFMFMSVLATLCFLEFYRQQM